LLLYEDRYGSTAQVPLLPRRRLDYCVTSHALASTGFTTALRLSEFLAVSFVWFNFRFARYSPVEVACAMGFFRQAKADVATNGVKGQQSI
jgi:hypothetical protein